MKARAPKRRPKLGQHFLHDRSVLDGIVAALAPSPDQLTIEVGPGQGVLTERLLAAGARVKAIELDTALSEALRQRFSDSDRFELIEDDVLNVDLREATRGEKAVLAGNLPYYITSPIVRRTLAAGDAFERAVFLVQEETARRICGRKGSRDYGYLSALVRSSADAERLFGVPPGCFRPPPRVDSAVIRLTPRGEAPPPESFLRFLEAAFRQPRKTLLNNISSRYGKDAVREQPEASLRAQQLDVEELRDLWDRLENATAKSPSPPAPAP